jgi:hypothetical protein
MIHYEESVKRKGGTEWEEPGGSLRALVFQPKQNLEHTCSLFPSPSVCSIRSLRRTYSDIVGLSDDTNTTSVESGVQRFVFVARARGNGAATPPYGTKTLSYIYFACKIRATRDHPVSLITGGGVRWPRERAFVPWLDGRGPQCQATL